MMKVKHFMVFGLLLVGLMCNAQSNYNRLMGRVNLAEDYFEAKYAFEELEQITCMVDYYPFMAAKAMNENHRFEGVQFLDKALRSGYSIQEFESRYNSAFSTLSQVTKDSLINYLELTNGISFNWHKRQLLESFFTEDMINEERYNCDTNKRILASSLRNLLNQYMRTEGLPSDCEVGYGMHMKSIRLLLNRSYLLYETEWNQIEEILTSALENYQLSSSLYASIIDTYLWLKHQTSLYGSSLYGKDEDQKAYIKANMDEINEARKKVGLRELNANED